MALSIATNQLINNYYDLYREDEIVFTKDILRSLHLDPRQVYVKCSGAQWPCIINSTSFQMAKIIIGTAGGAFQQITKKDAPPVSLRYCFIEQDNQPLIFFVSCRVSDVTPYMNSKDLAVITLTFTQRPPDDLIFKLGTLLAANDSFVKRSEERILINESTIRKLGLDKKESIAYIQNVPRRCILWNISFSGAKIIIMGIAKFIEGKDILIRLTFSEPNETIDMKGTIVSASNVEGRTDLIQAGIKFDANQVPLAYKIRINEYLTANRKSFLDASYRMQNVQDSDQTVATEAAATANALGLAETK
ncbi:MAG: PilZN3 domain-containing protein [Treponema sp.]